jgi:hypothetical protein
MTLSLSYTLSDGVNLNFIGNWEREKKEPLIRKNTLVCQLRVNFFRK